MLALAIFLSFIPSCKSAEVSLVDIARQEIGHGEQGGNNQGFYVKQYMKGHSGLPWCAGFVSFCLEKSGHHSPYLFKAKSFIKTGRAVKQPCPGDLIVFSRKGGGHVGIVELIANNKITTIEGNVGDYPSKVKRVVYRKGNIKNLLAFVRVKKS